MNNQLEQIKRLLAESSKEHRQEVFRELRQEFPIHSIEQKLNTEAEIILEAISRAGDLTLDLWPPELFPPRCLVFAQ